MRMCSCVVLPATLLGGLLLTLPAAAQSARDLADPGPAWVGITDTTSFGARLEAHVGEAERLLDDGGAEGTRTAENTESAIALLDRHLSPEALGQLADSVAAWVEAGEVVGAEVLIAKHGRVVFHETFGWADREAGRPMQTGALFNVASMTKPVVGTAVLMLADQGALSLDEPVARHLPAFDTEASRGITVRHLLTHTAGYDWWGPFDLRAEVAEQPDLRAAVDSAGVAGPQFILGDRYAYSNMSTMVLAALVAEISGVPVEQFLRERIFEPLGMADSHPTFSPDAPWAERVLPIYCWDRKSARFEECWHPSQPSRVPYFRGSGGLRTTAEDYLRFMTMWLDGGRLGDVRLLAQATVREALRTRAGRVYGYHWHVPEAPASDGLPPLFGHAGADGTAAAAFPAEGVVVLYFTQSGEGAPTPAPVRFFDLLGDLALLSHPGPYQLDAIRPDGIDALQLPPHGLPRYTGTYRMVEGPGGTLRIAERDGHLTAALESTEEAWSESLVRVADGTFAPGTYRNGRVVELSPPLRYLFTEAEGAVDAVEIRFEGELVFAFRRVPEAGETVEVAPPTGDSAADRRSVQAAFDAARPGETVRFAPGLYRLGAGARLTVPDVTVLGHPDGTTLQGCDPEAFDVPESDVAEVVFGCTGLYIQAPRQTIRGFTFEYAWHGIVIGPFPISEKEAGALGPEGPTPYRADGHRIEGNTFRATPNGLRVLGTGTEPSVVRDNEFIDVFHAIGIYGAPLHFLDNRVTVEDPARVPFSRHPGSAVLVAPGHTDCAGHVVAGNRVEGYPDPVYVSADPGETCRGLEIRDNTIRAGRVRIPAAWAGYAPTADDSTLVGVPITLMSHAPRDDEPGAGPAGVLEEIVVRGNRILGGEGLGILVRGASRSRFEANTIAGIERRSPFPGITWDGAEQAWGAANGSGLWLSPGSDGNEVVGNTFEDVAGFAVVVEGDSNRVVLDDPAAAARNLGTGNRIDRFVEAGGVRLHYLDFGGEGVPLVFVHSESWDAHSYAGFAPRFTDRARVLAVTRPGYGASEALQDSFSVATQAESLIAFLDALGIERAVFAGNSSPTKYLTYLAEHHPDRVAGLVYLAGLMPFWLQDVREGDPVGAGAANGRAIAALSGVSNDRSRALAAYRPDFLDDDRPPMDVPALAFAARSGSIGYERWNEALALVGSPLMAGLLRDLPPSPFADFMRRPAEDPDYRAQMLTGIEDPEARALLRRLADDPAQQEAVWRYQQDVVAPALEAGQERFRRAFGDGLQIVSLDVPVLHGYEYRDAPDLVEPYLRRFLDEVSSPEPD